MNATFDPAAWLTAFVDAGGSDALTADEKLRLGVRGPIG